MQQIHYTEHSLNLLKLERIEIKHKERMLEITKESPNTSGEGEGSLAFEQRRLEQERDCNDETISSPLHVAERCNNGALGKPPPTAFQKEKIASYSLVQNMNTSSNRMISVNFEEVKTKNAKHGETPSSTSRGEEAGSGTYQTQANAKSRSSSADKGLGSGEGPYLTATEISSSGDDKTSSSSNYATSAPPNDDQRNHKSINGNNTLDQDKSKGSLYVALQREENQQRIDQQNVPNSSIPYERKFDHCPRKTTKFQYVSVDSPKEENELRSVPLLPSPTELSSNSSQCSAKTHTSDLKDKTKPHPKKSPSDHESDGGYAGSASSNDVDNTSSTSDSSSLSEISNKNQDRSKPPGFNCRKRRRTRKYESSSSELADFSSDYTTPSENDQNKTSHRTSSRSYLSVDSYSDDSESAQETQTAKNQHSTIPVASTHLKNPGFPQKMSAVTPCSATVSFAAKKRFKCNEEENTDSCNDLEMSVKTGTKTTGLEQQPNSWDFIERSLKNKALNSSTRRKGYYTELKNHYNAAIGRFRSTDSYSSTYSQKATLRTTISVTNQGTKDHPSSHGTPIYNVGVDVMAKILTYLTPGEANYVLSEPISKSWRASFTVPRDVWKILCLSEPFHAKIDKKLDASDDSDGSYPICKNIDVPHVLGRYRLLHASFVWCVHYLDRIKNDALNGNIAIGVDDERDAMKSQFNGNSSLLRFFAQAKNLDMRSSDPEASGGSSGSFTSESKEDHNMEKDNDTKGSKTNNSKVKFATSALTRKLLGPDYKSGMVGNLFMPRSCAIYSIVNWMVAFADVSGIQMMCMSVLPTLLEDEKQRTTAHDAGVTDIILRAMVLFRDNAALHTSAFHTLVLLARPIGGREGMIFYSAMVNASGIFNIASNTGTSGIAIMLDSMKRFSSNERLQAMSCWSMVNIALIQSQKVALVMLGGISAAGNAMMQHPLSAEVQFRALFALINLVIPSENLATLEADEMRDQANGKNKVSEKDLLDDSVEQITHLVVTAMKNFCSSAAILNRACLVLHNLSLNVKYHNVLLWTPNCYQMIEWCIENYKHDKILQRSAQVTLQRIQTTLSNDDALRDRFTKYLRAQQKGVDESSTTLIQETPTLASTLSENNIERNP